MSQGQQTSGSIRNPRIFLLCRQVLLLVTGLIAASIVAALVFHSTTEGTFSNFNARSWPFFDPKTPTGEALFLLFLWMDSLLFSTLRKHSFAPAISPAGQLAQIERETYLLQLVAIDIPVTFGICAAWALAHRLEHTSVLGSGEAGISFSVG